jgi:TonB family protein
MAISSMWRRSAKASHEYGAGGYIDFTATPDFKIDHARHMILLTLMLDQEKPYRIGSVEVLGLDPAGESAVRQRISVGAIYDSDAVETAVEGVYEANRSSLPEIRAREFEVIKKDVKNGTVDVAVDFRPCGARAISSAAETENPTAVAIRDGIQVDEIQGLTLIKSGDVNWAAWPGANGVYGVVELSATVGRNGDVTDVKATSGPKVLVAGAVQAVKNSQFDPPENGTVTVAIRVAHVKN